MRRRANFYPRKPISQNMMATERQFDQKHKLQSNVLLSGGLRSISRDLHQPVMPVANLVNTGKRRFSSLVCQSSKGPILYWNLRFRYNWKYSATVYAIEPAVEVATRTSSPCHCWKKSTAKLLLYIAGADHWSEIAVVPQAVISSNGKSFYF
jgi:hypothetical protein